MIDDSIRCILEEINNTADRKKDKSGWSSYFWTRPKFYLKLNFILVSVLFAVKSFGVGVTIGDGLKFENFLKAIPSTEVFGV